VFWDGDYVPCTVTGPRADEILAFVRRREGRLALTAVQRFSVRAAGGGDWRGTEIRLPADAAGAGDVFTGYCPQGSALDPAQLFATLPIAVLVSPGDPP
jgi:maltooligosyltrehalose synthase